MPCPFAAPHSRNDTMQAGQTLVRVVRGPPRGSGLKAPPPVPDAAPGRYGWTVAQAPVRVFLTRAKQTRVEISTQSAT
jgi:hypothetical protein